MALWHPSTARPTISRAIVKVTNERNRVAIRLLQCPILNLVVPQVKSKIDWQCIEEKTLNSRSAR